MLENQILQEAEKTDYLNNLKWCTNRIIFLRFSALNCVECNLYTPEFRKGLQNISPQNFDSPEFYVTFWSNSHITGNFRAVSIANSYTHGQKSLVKIPYTSEKCISRPKLPNIMCEYDVIGYFDPKNDLIINSP